MDGSCGYMFVERTDMHGPCPVVLGVFLYVVKITCKDKVDERSALLIVRMKSVKVNFHCIEDEMCGAFQYPAV